ncbi:6469_t:CDS:1, partial [Dentiscutata heterogama]
TAIFIISKTLAHYPKSFWSFSKLLNSPETTSLSSDLQSRGSDIIFEELSNLPNDQKDF